MKEKNEFVPLPPNRPQPSEKELKMAEAQLERAKIKLALEKEAEKNRPPLTEAEKEILRRKELKAQLEREAIDRLKE